MEYDFIVGFTLFTPKGFKTMYRHFDKLETAKLFASNVNIKNNCKIYVDLEFHKDEMKNLINENNELHKEINRRIKLKIENEKIVDNEFISKNKIREKIEEYEELVKDFEEYWSKDPRKFKKEKSVDYYKIEALQELLNDNHIPHID